MVASSLLRDLSDCHQPWGIPRLPVPIPRVGVLASQGKGFTKPGGTPTRAWVGWDWRRKRGPSDVLSQEVEEAGTASK